MYNLDDEKIECEHLYLAGQERRECATFKDKPLLYLVLKYLFRFNAQGAQDDPAIN